MTTLNTDIDFKTELKEEKNQQPQIIIDDKHEHIYEHRSCCGRIKNAESSGFSQLEFLLRNGEKFKNPTVSKFVYVVTKGNVRKVYYNINKIPLLIGQCVVVDEEGAHLVGTVNLLDSLAEEKLNDHDKHKLLPKIIRIATDSDIEKMQHLHDDELQAVKETKKLVREFELDMKITEAQWQLDKQKLTIFFTAPQRVDFRDMVKELARLFKTRIELRQISTREETRRLGMDVGPCGRELCCTTFLKDFDHITLDHAKVQNLANNLSKLTGNCGRLKCCLKYEYETYQEEFSKYPPIHSLIETDEGIKKIIKIDVFKGVITCYSDSQGNYSNYQKEELDVFVENNKVFAPKEENKNGYHQNGNHTDETDSISPKEKVKKMKSKKLDSQNSN